MQRTIQQELDVFHILVLLFLTLALLVPQESPVGSEESMLSSTGGPHSAAPYPPSTVIKGIEWAPPETIIRRAAGSDNWPMTWADDDALYTAYGDGKGFEPFLAEKLSLGLARVVGSPPEVIGTNLRAAVESKGDGQAGTKASGILMVDGVLYLWVRNAGNSQLAWSTDRGRTWKWSDWKFTTSFGCPTILNYGKNYAGARDGYIYLYSHDSDSAYTPADRMVMARVPKDRIRERGAYEFFKALGNNNQPIWTKQISDRGPVFSHPARCYRSGISYNPGLKRYLWSQTLPGSDARFKGGFGIYDAPEPWGPWTTVYFTEEWDVGPGETSSFPPKWMSADGLTLHLVFSGQDSFSVRRSRLITTRPQRADKQFEWEMATPESEGMSSKKLDALKDVLAANKTKAFLVIRNDRIVYEWYAENHSATARHGTASLAKAIVGGLSFGVAMTDGRLKLDDQVSKYVPQWKDDPQKSRITLRHLGAHASGLDDAEADRLPHDKLAGWKGDFWKRLDPPNDPFSISRDQTPILFNPGEKLQYSNPGIAMLTYAVTASLRAAPEKDIRTMLRDRVMRPIGVSGEEWSCGYGKTYLVEGLPLVASWGGGSYTARAVARIGRLVLRRGNWDGSRILSEEAVRQITSDAGLPGNCGMGWWTNGGGRYEKIPRDTIYGAGAGDQVLLVIPSLNLIMVRNGETLGHGQNPLDASNKQRDVFSEFHDTRCRILLEPLIGAITNRG
jgi:CubicO group peptidase (beta-lactamase class C family)